MVSRQIIVFKCVVSLCDQDFGVYCRERDPEGKKRFGEQPGATKPAPGCGLEALVEEQSGFEAVGWWVWAALTTYNVCQWLWAMRSLLGWLWWHWIFLLLRDCDN